ncbi:MAG: hypothetical protein K2Q20_12335 [Phycisphaerales bacterium]|nr:hypothetical protein [Phycisphaerales bacterium]
MIIDGSHELLPRLSNDYRNEWDHQAAAELCQQFSRSGQLSIDRFLEGHVGGKSVQALGKQMIAHWLLPLEAEAIRDRSLAEGWYQQLFNTIVCLKKRSVSVPGLSVVTFNYDRTFEYAMLTMLANSLGDRVSPPGPEALMPVIHVYGKLSSRYHWDPQDCYYEQRGLAPVDVADSANCIQIVSTERQASESANVNEARALIKAADHVIFLGFGFDATNLSMIGLGPGYSPQPGHGPVKFLKACAYDIGDQERQRVDQRLSSIDSDRPVHVALGQRGWDCDTFLKEGVSLEETLFTNLRAHRA